MNRLFSFILFFCIPSISFAQTEVKAQTYYGIAYSDTMYETDLEETAIVEVTIELKEDSSYLISWQHNLAKWWLGMDSIWYNTGTYFIENDFIFFTLHEDDAYLASGNCDYPIRSMSQEGLMQFTKKQMKQIHKSTSIHSEFEYYLKIENGNAIRFHIGWDMFEEIWIDHEVLKQAFVSE